MTSFIESETRSEIFYASKDGEPLAESCVHLYAILTTLEVLRQYLSDQQATVLSNQFLSLFHKKTPNIIFDLLG